LSTAWEHALGRPFTSMSDLYQFREAQDESLPAAYRLAALDSLEASFIFLTDEEKALFRELQERLYRPLQQWIEEERVRLEEWAQQNAPPVQEELFLASPPAGRLERHLAPLPIDDEPQVVPDEAPQAQ
jgi:hypothetical protein